METKHEFEFIRLIGDERRTGETLQSVSKHWQGDKECFMMVSPHDDDVVLGAGLLIQLAHRENVPVYVVIVTDGSMGYCSAEERDSISEIRREETFTCYESLGIPRENIIWLGFPDCQLSAYRGKRAAKQDDPAQIEGFTGLQNAFTHCIRKINPTQCFLPTSNDLHPDHKIVHEELLISIFHANGDVWPELGAPVSKVPYIHEMAVYCDFPVAPQLRVTTPQAYLDAKTKAIKAFESQKQISSLIEIVEANGPQEYLRALDFALYHPAGYRDLFDKKHHFPFMH